MAPPTDTDPFTLQRRLDDFRAALGDLGALVTAGTNIDEALDAADRRGWTATGIGQTVAAQLANVPGAGVGLAVARLIDLSTTSPPPIPTAHATAAVLAAKPGRFRQPLRPCGVCDGTPARWREVDMGPDYLGQTVVEHCPLCWTQPPGYIHPEERNRRARESIYGRDERTTLR